MRKFIHTADGRINEAEIVRIDDGPSDHRYDVFYRGENGELVKTWAYMASVEDVGGVYIQALPGYSIVRAPLDDRAAPEHLKPVTLPIVAWRIGDLGAQPITVENCPREYAILCPTGQVICPEEGIFASIEEYVAEYHAAKSRRNA